MGNKSALKAEFQIKTIEGRIRGLAKSLFKLAPHPDNPAHYGSLSISLNTAFKPAAEYDGMLGNIMLESALNDVFAQAANDNTAATAQNINYIDNVADLFSEYLQDRENTKKNTTRGQGTFGIGQHQTICNQFNDESEGLLRAFLQDLPQRLQLEETIADLSRSLDSLTRYKEEEPSLLYA